MTTRQPIALIATVSLATALAAGCGIVPFSLQADPPGLPDEASSSSAAEPAPSTSERVPKPPPSTTQPSPAAPETAAPNSAEEPAPTYQCEYESVTGISSDTRLVEFSSQVYERIDCTASESLESQMVALTSDIGITAEADEGWFAMTYMSVQDPTYGVVHGLMIYNQSDSSRGCLVMVTDAPRTKAMDCSVSDLPAL